MARSVAIIGAGQIGFAASCNFAREGCEVTVHSRSRPSWLSAERERFEPYLIGEHAAPEADVVVDTLAFDGEDVARYDPDMVGRLIVISSASVYSDSDGRTLDEAAQNGFPEFGGPISEDQPTVAAGPETYSTRKVRMEQEALQLFGERTAILRPCAVHGPFSKHAREWWFVKRMLDGRKRIPLIHSGESIFHTTSADSIGQVAVAVSNCDTGGVFNIGDDAPPSVSEIGQVIADALDREPECVPIEGGEGLVGRTPWSVPRSLIVSSARLKNSGFAGERSYAETAAEAVKWLGDLNPADWRAALPQLAAYPWDLFDYEAEDRFLASL